MWCSGTASSKTGLMARWSQAKWIKQLLLSSQKFKSSVAAISSRIPTMKKDDDPQRAGLTRLPSPVFAIPSARFWLPEVSGSAAKMPRVRDTEIQS